MWLNIIHKGSQTPWFTARLAEGNSLLGARRQVFEAASLLDGNWLNKVPERVPLAAKRPGDTVYHFLVPDQGMVAYDKDKVIKELAKGHIERMKKWRGKFCDKYTVDEVETLQNLSRRTDELWQRYLKKRKEMLRRTSEQVEVWGQDKRADSDIQLAVNFTRDIDSKEKELGDQKKPEFESLKLIMDYWCALWFWPIEKSELLPTRDEYLMDISAILDAGFLAITELGQLAALPRLQVVRGVAARIKFHHWELVFAEVFNERSGFDLIVGNPPWVKVQWEEKGILSDNNPVLSLRNVSASETARMRDELMAVAGVKSAYNNEFEESNGIKSFLNAVQNYPLLQGMQTNVYKCFITQAWWLGSDDGVAGFLHPDGVYDDSNGGLLREAVYPRLCYHFQFSNELKLFPEIGNQAKYSINIYRSRITKNNTFYNLSNLFHPATVHACFQHDGTGSVPGIKNVNFQWELRGHRNRIIEINDNSLMLYASLYDKPGTLSASARLPVLHSREIMSVLVKLAEHPSKLGDNNGQFFTTEMLHETNAQKAGIIQREIRCPADSRELVLSGPHFFVSNPFYQNP